MEIKDLRIFQSVAEAGSISKGAKALNFVQSHVTARIKALETELDTQLFLRHSRGGDTHIGRDETGGLCAADNGPHRRHGKGFQGYRQPHRQPEHRYGGNHREAAGHPFHVPAHLSRDNIGPHV
ncbi:helix-turn-helix domain-containing protein [Salinicoccus roseus]|uniref:helix-turn-helix domain-containing protein n=1 Tax=Salinicoccus roseus TaxID=45670 RepID=UPI003D9FDC50